MSLTSRLSRLDNGPFVSSFVGSFLNFRNNISPAALGLLSNGEIKPFVSAVSTLPLQQFTLKINWGRLRVLRGKIENCSKVRRAVVFLTCLESLTCVTPHRTQMKSWTLPRRGKA